MRPVYTCAALLLAYCCVAYTQEDVLRPKGGPGGSDVGTKHTKKRAFVLGLEAGLNINFMSQPYTSNPQIRNSPEEALKRGTGLSPEIGVFADYSLSDRVGLQFRVAYDQKLASNTKTGIIDATPIEGIWGDESIGISESVQGVPQIVPMETEAFYSLTMNTIALALTARIDIVDNFFVSLGPYATIALGDVTRKDRLTRIAPEETSINVDYNGTAGQYTQIERESNLAQNLLPAVGTGEYTASTYSTTRIGVELGVGYRFTIAPGFYLAPNLRYQYMVTELSTNFTAQDISQTFSQSQAVLQYDKASLNSLALILQLGFTL